MLWNLLIAAVLAYTSAAAPAAAPPPEATVSALQPGAFPPLELRVDGAPVQGGIASAFVLPGEELAIEKISGADGAELQYPAGTVEVMGSGWRWHAPREPGLYPIRLAEAGTPGVLVNAFVMVPYAEMTHGRLGRTRIGDYPRARAGYASYDRPRGFVVVDAGDDSVRVSPHFRLGQFVCKQQSGYPKYVVLQPTLLHKLEQVLATVQRHGIETETLQLMSAYRTPVYNVGIGNRTTFSRHQYGDAADVFIDQHPADGRMDDLDGDGRSTRADARLLGRWVEDLERRHEHDTAIGGLSAYGPTLSHGPFVHIDARGYPARW